MRIAVISDIHGNWEALQAVAEDIRASRAEAVFCLGDVIGYGADPSACLDWVAENCRRVIRGNHEAALLDPREMVRMNEAASAALLWTADQLTSGPRELLAGWPLTALEEGNLLVHASPDNPEQFSYLTSKADLQQSFAAFKESVCFFGHTHTPLAAEWDPVASGLKFISPGKMELRTARRYLINVGSVGQPRDGDPRARWVLWEPGYIEYHWVDYPVQTAQEKIRKAGLPKFLAERLKFGN